jgi:hypothetical protein
MKTNDNWKQYHIKFNDVLKHKHTHNSLGRFGRGIILANVKHGEVTPLYSSTNLGLWAKSCLWLGRRCVSVIRSEQLCSKRNSDFTSEILSLNRCQLATFSPKNSCPRLLFGKLSTATSTTIWRNLIESPEYIGRTNQIPIIRMWRRDMRPWSTLSRNVIGLVLVKLGLSKHIVPLNLVGVIPMSRQTHRNLPFYPWSSATFHVVFQSPTRGWVYVDWNWTSPLQGWLPEL